MVTKKNIFFFIDIGTLCRERQGEAGAREKNQDAIKVQHLLHYN